MALNRDLNDLAPEIREKARVFLSKLSAAGIPVHVVETRRTIAVQWAYYAQGRESLASVNTLRKAAGLWPITEDENRRKITWTKKSKHLDGLALDVVPLRDGKPWWTAPLSLWLRIGQIGESCGLCWGGRWSQYPDRPHFEV